MRHNPFEAKILGGSYQNHLELQRKRNKKHKTILSEIEVVVFVVEDIVPVVKAGVTGCA